MQIKSIQQRPTIHIAHQSELINMQKQMALMKQQIDQLTLQLMKIEAIDTKTNAIKSIVDDKIKLPAENGYEWLAIDRIFYCEANGNYCKIIALDDSKENKTKTFLVSKTLKVFSMQLSTFDFIRCHQSYLVNKKYVTGYSNNKGPQLRLTNEKIIPVSRRNKKEVLEMYSRF